MDEIKKSGPKLSGIEKENAFSVPDNYFDELPGRIQDSIREDGARGKDRPRLRKLLKSRLGIAAAILGFALIGYMTITFLITDPGNNELSSDEIAEFIEFYSSDVTEEMFYEIIRDDQPANQDNGEYTEVMINYLLDQGIDYLSIIEEL